MKETFWEKRRQSLENITSERGIHLRMLRHLLFVANPGKMRYNVFKTKHTDKLEFDEVIKDG